MLALRIRRLRAAYLAFLPLCVSAAQFQAADYGARGDGQAVETAAIQRAIDAAAPSGGTVVFKAGTYLSGAIFLKSGVHFQVDEGVTIRGVHTLEAYPEMPTRVAGIEMTWPAALINVYQQSNVSIGGKGVIDGDGKYWWDSYWALRKQYEPRGLRWASDYDAKRVRLIQVYQSSDVKLSGLTLERSGFWTVHLCYSNHVSVDGLTIQNNIGGRGPSTDGIDVDSSSDIAISGCDISCNDDAICMKAGRDADGLRVNRPTQNVTVRDCTIRQGAAGITIGSETSGGIRDIRVSGLHVTRDVPKGICFKSAKTRGGTVEHVQISDLNLEGVAVPISVTVNWNPSYSYAQIPAGMENVPDYWRVLAQPVPPDKGLPHFRHISISDVNATGAKRAIEASGVAAAPLEDFTFDNLNLQALTAGEIANAVGWSFKRSTIKTDDGSKVEVKDSRDIRGLPED